MICVEPLPIRLEHSMSHPFQPSAKRGDGERCDSIIIIKTISKVYNFTLKRSTHDSLHNLLRIMYNCALAIKDLPLLIDRFTLFTGTRSTRHSKRLSITPTE